MQEGRAQQDLITNSGFVYTMLLLDYLFKGFKRVDFRGLEFNNYLRWTKDFEPT